MRASYMTWLLRAKGPLNLQIVGLGHRGAWSGLEAEFIPIVFADVEDSVFVEQEVLTFNPHQGA